MSQTSEPSMQLPDLSKPEAQVLVVAGIVGGLLIGRSAIHHMFVEGMTAKERKNMLIFSASCLAAWGASKLIDLETYWFLLPDTIVQKAAQELKP